MWFQSYTLKTAPLLLDIPYDDYIYESEMIYQAAKNNLNVDEISIKCIYGEEKSYIRIWHVFRYIKFILNRNIYKFRKEVKI